MIQATIVYITVQSFIFSILLIPSKKKENKWLGVFFGVKFIWSSYSILNYEGQELTNNLGVAYFMEVIDTFTPILIASYCAALLNQKVKKVLSLLWVVPFLIFGIFCLFGKLGFYTNPEEFRISKTISFTGIVFLVIYLLFLVWQKQYLSKALRTDVENEIILKKKVSLYYLKYFLTWEIVVGVFMLTFFISLNSYPQRDLYNVQQSFAKISLFAGALFFLVLGYLALRNPYLFNDSDNQPLTVEEKLIQSVLPSSEKSRYSDEEIAECIEQLVDLFETREIFKQQDLNLQKLAQQAGTSSHKVSYCINRHWKENLNQVLKHYRIDYARKLLSDPNQKELTIYAVAAESGFNSEPTFYTSFKKQMAMTPNEFKAMIQQNNG